MSAEDGVSASRCKYRLQYDLVGGNVKNKDQSKKPKTYNSAEFFKGICACFIAYLIWYRGGVGLFSLSFARLK